MRVIWCVFLLLYHVKRAMFVLPLVYFYSLISQIDRLFVHHLTRHHVCRSSVLMLVLTCCVVSLRESILDSSNRTVISVAVSLQVLDAG